MGYTEFRKIFEISVNLTAVQIKSVKIDESHQTSCQVPRCCFPQSYIELSSLNIMSNRLLDQELVP